MRSNLIRACVAAAIFVGGTSNGITAGGPFTRGCAGRDIQVMMMLEAGTISPQRLNDAVRSIMHARMICLDGHVAEALEIYDQIAHSIASDWSLAGH